MSQIDRVLKAVKNGAQDGKAIAKKARIPYPNVHPLLNRARARGLLVGKTGKLQVK